LQVSPHVLAVHVGDEVAVVGQTMLQPPQLRTSVSISTQLPPHFTSGEAQRKPQTELLHVGMAPGGAGQTFVQLPQNCGSDVRSTHEPLHEVSPPVQPARHAPVAHDSPVAHAMVQSPQCAASDDKSTQLPLQSL
jgi:hypothetical protein